MIKFNRLSTIITKTRLKYLILVIFALAIGLFVQKIQEPKQSKQDLYRAFGKITQRIHKKWKFGSSKSSVQDMDLECGEHFPDTNSMSLEDFRCNPDFLECVFAGKIKSEVNILTTKVNDQVFDFKVNKKDTRSVAVSGKNSYQIILKSQGEYFSIILKNDCHEVEVPQEIYKTQSGIDWDNKGRRFFVDKYYVNNRDIHEWRLKNNIPSKIEAAKYYLPSLDLNLNDRNKYCHSLGKELLHTHLFEAVGHYYVRTGENLYSTHQLPWTKKKKSFLRKRKKINNLDCHKAYVKGCKKLFTFKNKIAIGLGQSGVSHILGSYSESLINIYNPTLNLKVSSVVLTKSSKWHAVGEYARWKGESTDESDIDWEDRVPRYKSDDYPIAFRCQREQL